MKLAQAPNAFTQHYLEIQALEPAADNHTVVEEPPTSVWFISLPIIIFLLVFFAGFGWMFYQRMQQMRTVFAIFITALFMASLPLAMHLVDQQTAITTKADPNITPQNIIVQDVTPQSFSISWETSKPTPGAIKVSTQSDMQGNSFVLSDTNILTFHQIDVDSLDPTTTYYIQVLSDTLWFDHAGQPLMITTPVR